MNKILKKLFLLLLFAFLFLNHLCANIQGHGLPVVGKPCPDFILTNLVNSKKPKISLKDFRGKWLMIDIWESTCAVCIHKFPMVSGLQNQFSNQLSVLLIGINDTHYNKDIKQLYLKLEKRMHFQLLAAFDTVLSSQWGVFSLPYIVLVNPLGIVYAITNGLDMDSLKIQQMIAGKNPEFMSHERKVAFDYNKPLLINSNGGPDTAFLYRSILSHYIDEDYFIPPNVNFYLDTNKAGFQVVGATLYRLYYFAYVGQWIWGLFKDSLFDTVSPTLELNIRDSSLFNWDIKKRKNFFNYSLFLPSGKKDPHLIMQVLQRELKNCFGFEAQLETRDVPCWTLTVRKDTVVSLRSTGQDSQRIVTPMELHYKNSSVEELLGSIASYHQDETPFIDETGIDYPIDVQIDALLTDLSDIQGELRKNGLELVKKKRPMKVIVIRDPAAQ